MFNREPAQRTGFHGTYPLGQNNEPNRPLDRNGKNYPTSAIRPKWEANEKEVSEWPVCHSKTSLVLIVPYWMFVISSSDNPDACTMVSIGTPSDRRLAAILSFVSFSPSARPSARPSAIFFFSAVLMAFTISR